MYATSFTELFNLLINPVSHDFALRWHRDDVPESTPEIEEQEALNIWHYGVRPAMFFQRFDCNQHCSQGAVEYVSCLTCSPPLLKHL